MSAKTIVEASSLRQKWDEFRAQMNDELIAARPVGGTTVSAHCEPHQKRKYGVSIGKHPARPKKG